MSTIKISDLADVRAGDIVTVKHQDNTYTGPCQETTSGVLWFIGYALRLSDGRPDSTITFVSAEREIPPAPTGECLAWVRLKNGREGYAALNVIPCSTTVFAHRIIMGPDQGWFSTDGIADWRLVDMIDLPALRGVRDEQTN